MMKTRTCLNKASLVAFFLIFLATGLMSPIAFAKETNSIRLGIISLAPPSKVYAQWQNFSDYLSGQIGQPVEIVVPRGFKKIKAAVEEKTVDIFYVNSHIFYRLKQAGHAKALAQMENLNGSATSKSVIFARKSSHINSLGDLMGQKVAFVAPMGAGGYLAPRALFNHQGINTKTQLQEEFTKNLSSSIHKVLLGDVKAGTMCGLNFDLMSKRIETGDLEVIAESDDYPENVIGIRADINKNVMEKLRKIIVNMDKDTEGKEILRSMSKMKIKRFVSYDENIEKITMKLLSEGNF